MFFSTVASQYFVGSGCPTGHSINSVSSPRFAAPLIGAVRTRTRAKRERGLSFGPSRQVIVRQACFGRLSANCLVLRRACSAPRSDTLRTLTVGTIAAAYLSPRALMPVRNGELEPYLASISTAPRGTPAA